jgi:hypothetical protein
VDGQNLENALVSLPRTVSSVGQADNRAAATHEDALSGAATGISAYTQLLLNARCLIYRQLRIEVNCADWKMRSLPGDRVASHSAHDLDFEACSAYR